MSLEIQKNKSLSLLTTFGVGGAASHYVQVADAKDLMEAEEYAEAKGLKTYFLGGGSNILFSDKGFDGLVIHLVGDVIGEEGEKLWVSGGQNLQSVVDLAAKRGLGGIESLAGIPGSFGGAIRGNAGAFGVEIGDVTLSVKALNLESGIIKQFSKTECQFGYRQSFFKQHREWVVLSGELGLIPHQDPDTLERSGKETRQKREGKHPQAIPSAGSFFMNPVVKNPALRKEFEKDTGLIPRGERLPAGWLIDHVGLRGKKIGGAQMSPYHPNYLINTGKATAEDIVTLASLVKTRVRDELGVRLQEEVQLVGF